MHFLTLSIVIMAKRNDKFCFLTFISVLYLTCDSAPIARCLIDMSYVFDNDTTLNFPSVKKYEMNLFMNVTWKDTIWLQYEEISLGTHVGTHIDAMSDFIVGGKNIEELPLARLMAPAAVIDITDRATLDRDAEATVDDLLHWESVTGQSLDGTIVLLRSGWGQHWSNETAFMGNADRDPDNLHYPGLAKEAAQWLVDNRKISATGTETLSIDHGPSTHYESHIILLGAEIPILENVANMDKIPIYGAMIYALPMNLRKASGAPVRVVATYPEVIFNPLRSSC